MPNYKQEAEELFKRVQRLTRAKPTQKAIIDYVTKQGKRPLTRRQAKFVELVMSIQGVQGYTRKDGKHIAGYTKTNRKWTSRDEEYVRTHSIEEAIHTLSGRHTDQAIRKKRYRLLKA